MKRAALLGAGILWAGGWVGAPAFAQPLRVFSEFAKIDAQGNVTSPETPREILSPAIARNAFSTFQVAIQAPVGKPYTLRIGLNPENAIKVTLYRQTGETLPIGGTKLEPITEPWQSDSTQIVWMDLWVEKDAPVRRVKVEPQLLIDGDWVIYPMEVRVREPQVPDAVSKAASFVDAFTVLQGSLCMKPLSIPGLSAITAAGLRYRNAMQDVALAGAASASDREELKKRLGGCDARPPANPETYLRARDYFFTPLWMKVKGN